MSKLIKNYLRDKVDLNDPLWKKMIDEGYIDMKCHPHDDLYILCYTPKTQYEQMWNDATLQARGLIIRGDGFIKAKPFPKFFNMSELTEEEIPYTHRFLISEKVDGALGILYWDKSESPRIATKGSFVSDAAMRATDILHNTYSVYFPHLDKNVTYLFEIIDPVTRVVVNYGEKEELVPLRAHTTNIPYNKTTEDHIGNLWTSSLNNVKSIGEGKERLQELLLETMEAGTANREGMVITFSNGMMMKVKFEEYVRLHRIVTGLSSKTVWEYLKDRRSFDELLGKVPDEYFYYIKKTKAELEAQYKEMRDRVEDEFFKIIDKKDFAEKAIRSDIKDLLFTRLNTSSPGLEDAIWKKLKPEFKKPYFGKEDTDDKGNTN